MKVKDLILRLQKCNPENIVVVDGYEGGVSELKNIRASVEVSLDVNKEDYYGTHELGRNDDYARCTATYLPRP
jgi:hypothetical protein